jgi:hypothetical protein
MMLKFAFMKFWVFVLCAVGIVWASPARAEDSKKAACASAYEKSQEFRTQNKLQKAQELLVICAEPSCPTFVQTDCAQWLTEVQKDMPSIIIVAKDKDGAEVTAVKVLIDGEVVASELDGKAILIDPGKHKLRFEMEGAPSVDQPIVAKQGEKDRQIKVSFRPQAAEKEAPNPYAGAADTGTEPPPEEDRTGPGPLRIPAYIAGGVGAAGLISFALFGIMASGAQSDLENSGCKPNCSQSEVDSIKSKYMIANISLGVGIVGLGAGVTMFFLSQPKKKPNDEESKKPRFDLAALPGGGYATMSGRF